MAADWSEDRPPSSSVPSKAPVRTEAEVRNRDLQRLQGLQMLLERVSGASIPELAKRYDIPKAAVEERLTQAWQDGVVAELQAQMIERLAPMVMAVYEAQLRMGNLDAARDIGGTLGLIKRPGQKDPKSASQVINPTLVISSIDDYRTQRERLRLRAADRRPRMIVTAESDEVQ